MILPWKSCYGIMAFPKLCSCNVTQSNAPCWHSKTSPEPMCCQYSWYFCEFWGVFWNFQLIKSCNFCKQVVIKLPPKQVKESVFACDKGCWNNIFHTTLFYNCSQTAHVFLLGFIPGTLFLCWPIIHIQYIKVPHSQINTIHFGI